MNLYRIWAIKNGTRRYIIDTVTAIDILDAENIVSRKYGTTNIELENRGPASEKVWLPELAEVVA